MKVIGRRDFIDFPEWSLFDIEAKVDTGAYGCALHCHHVEVSEKDGRSVLRFKLLDPSHPGYQDQWIYSERYKYKKVKNSGGESELRFIIQTQIMIFGQKYTTEFSLADRQKMKYPVLIGRKFLNRRFLVDVSKKNMSRNQQLSAK